MAPEVLCALNHGTVVDYFAVGVIGYEFMKGERPYLGKSRKEIKEKVLAKQVQVKKCNIPSDWSTDAADFVNKTLQRKPSLRLGLRGAIEIKEHSWFKYYSWKDLYLQKLTSPFIPKMGDNFDSKYCNKKEQLGMTTIERYAQFKKNGKCVKEFKNFLDFNREVNELESKVSNYHLLKFVNPHDIYNEDNQDSNSKHEKNVSDSSSTIFNRNMLSNKSTDDESTEKILGRYQSAKNLLAFDDSHPFEKHLNSNENNNRILYKNGRGLYVTKKVNTGLNTSMLNKSYYHKTSGSGMRIAGKKY